MLVINIQLMKVFKI